jgi:peptide/nickel transport system substrate-binding protein
LLITRHLYEGLTAFEPGTTRVRPALAQSWQTSANGLVWTFRMRPDVVFSDGTPLTAEVARRNFERWLTRTPAGRYAFWRLMFGGFAGQTDEAGTPLSTVAAVTATTPSTLVLTLNRPDSALPNTLAMPAFALVNPDAWEASGFGGPGAPSAGTGPFTLVAWSAAVVQLERNPAYWGTPAKPDGLLFKGIADDVQRLTALQVGEVDGLARLPPSDYDLAARWPALRVEFDPPLEVLYLGINQARAPWDDLNCRLAVALAMDPARYARDFFPGDAEPATAMQPPSVWGYAAPSAERAPDLAQAQELWQACLAAQPAPPVEITFYVPPIPRSYLPDPAGLGSAVQTDLASAGITVTVRSPDWTSAWLPEVQAGHADLFLLGWAGVNGDPDAYLCPLFCGLNAAFNSNQAGLPLPPDAGLARLLQEAHTAASPARREQLYAQAHARIFESVPAVPLAYRRTAWAFRVDLAGSVPSPIENVFFGLEVRPAP